VFDCRNPVALIEARRTASGTFAGPGIDSHRGQTPMVL
jgi:hypothetical protein